MTDIIRPSGHSTVVNAAEAVVRAANAVDSTINHDGKPGSGITVPKTMTLRNAVRKLEEYAQAEQEKTQLRHIVNYMHFFPAALAFRKLLSDHYGVDFAKPQPGFFGVQYPVDYTIPTGPNEIQTITLGEFTLGDMKVETSPQSQDGVPRLGITITCKNSDKAKAEELISLTSNMPDIWRGQCLAFEGSDDLRIPKIGAPDLSIDSIALNPPERSAVQMFLNQISNHRVLLSDHGIPFKRGVLLYGPWGTGKTLAAAVAMRAATDAGITVLQERSWSNLHNTMRLARDMQPCMVFCEDIDLASNRSLTNILDDATLKTCAVSLVVTTNHPEKLEPALTRTGRLDICVGFQLPEPETRARILAINGADYFSSDISTATEGFTGSDLAEVAKRAIINAVAAGRAMTADDVLAGAVSMQRPPKYEQPDSLISQLQAVFNAGLQNAADESLFDRLQYIANTTDNIENSVC